jgi:hypothetical protein
VLFWGDDPSIHGRGSKGDDFLWKGFGNALVDGGTTGNYDGSIEILTEADMVWLEQQFWAPESYFSDGDYVAIGKPVTVLNLGWGGGLSSSVRRRTIQGVRSRSAGFRRKMAWGNE